MSFKIEIKELTSFSLALVAISLFNPFFIWDTFEFGWFFKILIFTFVSAFLFKEVLSFKFSKRDLIVLALCFPFLFYRYGINGNGTSGSLIQFTLSSGLFLLSILLMRKDMERAYFYFKRIFGFFAFNSLLIWILAFLGVISYSSFPTVDAEEIIKRESGIQYYISFFVTWIDSLTLCFGSSCVNRINGPFSEPGLFGTVAALILCANRFTLKEWSSWSIFFAGILSFSLAFYIISFVYLFFVRLKIALITSSIIFLFFYFYSNPFIDRLILSRFSIGESGISGNNRTSIEFDHYFNQLLDSGNYIFGMGFQAHAQLGVDVSSWKVLIYNHGVLGFSLFILSLLSIYFYFSSKPLGKYSLAFFMVFLASIYQRPDVLNFQFLFIFVSGLVLAVDKKFEMSNKFQNKEFCSVSN